MIWCLLMIFVYFAQVQEGCKVYLMCVRLIQNRMELFSIAAKLFVWRLRLRVHKAQSPHYWHWVVKTLNLLTTTNIWELYWILCSQIAKTFRDHCDTNIVLQTSCEPLFPDVQMQLKMYFVVPSVRPCMHHNCGAISGSHACRDLRVAYNFECRALDQGSATFA